MESEKTGGRYQDNRNASRSRQSVRSTKSDSRESSLPHHKNDFRDQIQQDEDEKGDCAESRTKTRNCHPDPDQDEVSEGEERRSRQSFYSDAYESASPSERSISPFSRSRTPSPAPHKGMRAKRISSSLIYKTAGGVGRRGGSRPHHPGGQHRRGVRSQSKESTPPKDLDLVTKRMLSARLLKINELHNNLAELQRRTDELQKENRILRQLHVRQEKALQRYDDTESEISQLLSRHNNETQVLREQLRRNQERGRATERQLRDSEEQLHRSQKTIGRLKKLVDQQELGTRDELSRKLDKEKNRAQEAEQKIKELERNMELSTNSFTRQLAAERKKTVGAQEETRTLQEQLERLTSKLKEKERELDTKNIYANRKMKPSLKTDADSGTKRKVPSRNSSKAAQTQHRGASLDFPTPPPAVTDTNACGGQTADEYLSFKELGRVDRQSETEGRQQKLEQQKIQDKDKDKEEVMKEKKHLLSRELSGLEEKTLRLRDGREKENEEEERKEVTLSPREGNNGTRGHVLEDVRWNQDVLANQHAAGDARRKKEQLLAKMREIDSQNQRTQTAMFAERPPSESNKGASDPSSPRPPEPRKNNSSTFSLKEPEAAAGLPDGAGTRRSGSDGGAASGAGRRALRSLNSGDDVAFGSYAPSFGNSTPRGLSGFPPPPSRGDRDSALEAIGVFSLRGAESGKDKGTGRGVEKDRKSNLMQQLFGVVATPAGDGTSAINGAEVLAGPPASTGVRPRREGLLSFSSESSTPPASAMNTLHVAESRPAVRNIASFDDDIEELTL